MKPPLCLFYLGIGSLLLVNSLEGEEKGAKPEAAPKEEKAKRGNDAGGQPKPVETKPEAGKEQKEAEPPEGKRWIEVKPEPFVVETEIAGIVESRKMVPVQLVPESWGEWIIEEVVDYGTAVKKGDRLMRFDSEKLEETIEEKRAGLPLKRLRLEVAKAELEKMRKSVPLELEEKRRRKSETEADFAYFEDVRREVEEREAREDLKYFQNFLAYSEEELKQLKKMYENDDMTEETEEIILKRAQDSVDRSRWQAESAEVRSNRRITTLLPREHLTLRANLERTRLEWRDAEKAAHHSLATKSEEVREQERTLEKEEQALKDLEADLGIADFRAPADGIVYYGENRRGKWVTADAIEKKLVPGGRHPTQVTVMTVADPGALQVRAAVPEDKLGGLGEGQKAEVTMKWNEDLKLDGRVQSVSHVPYPDGTFDALFSLNVARTELPVLPGMNAKLVVETYRKDEALVLPEDALIEEGGRKFVTLKGGKKRAVETGKSQKKKIEILGGLRSGDVVEAPAAKEDAKE